MDLFLYMVLGLAATWGGYVLYMLVATRASEAGPPHRCSRYSRQLARVAWTRSGLCFSPRCGPVPADVQRRGYSCRQRGTGFQTRHHQSTRRFLANSASARPDLIVVEDGAVARMVLGVKNASYMQRLMDATPA